MEELLSGLNKFNVKTEDELFAEQFSKLSADNNINNTGNQLFPSNQYTTHKMFGNDVPHSTNTSLKQDHFNINTNEINSVTWLENKNNEDAEVVNTNEINSITWLENKNNEDAEVVGWNQTQKAIEEEGWGNLPDVNTSVNPNHTFGMNSILSAEILNLGKANVNQQRIFGSEYMNKQSNTSSNTNNPQFDNKLTTSYNTKSTRAFTIFRSSNRNN